MQGLSDGAILILWILALLYGILMFFLPFFVYQIRNLMIKQNRMLEQIAANTDRGGGRSVQMDPTIKRCASCGAKNRSQDNTCTNCGKPI